MSIAVLTLASLPLTRPCGADDGLLARVRSEYPQALSRLEEAYGKVEGSGTAKTVLQPGKPTERRIQTDCSFVVDGFSQKAARLTTATTAKSEAAGLEPARVDEVLVRNPRYYFKVRRPDPGGIYHVEGYGDPKDAEADANLQSMFRDFLSAPYGIMGDPVSKLMATPDFVITGAEPVTAEGRDLIRIRCKYDSITQGKTVFQSEMVVDPAIGWAIRAYECKHGPSGKTLWKARIEYGDGNLAGAPVPRQVSIDLFTGTRRQFDFREIKPLAKGDEAAFLLTAYGLPEMGQVPDAGWAVGGSVWIFGLAFVALGVCVALKAYERRWKLA